MTLHALSSLSVHHVARRIVRFGSASAAAALVAFAGMNSTAHADEPAPAGTAPAADKDGADKPAAASDAKTIKLAERWVKGHQQKFELEIDRFVKLVSQSDAVPNAEQKLHQRVGIMMRLADVDPRGSVFNFFITDLDATVTMKDKNYEFSSSSPSSEDKGNPLAEAMRPLVGLTLKVVVNGDGDIVSSLGHHNAIVPGQFGLYAEDLVGPTAIKRDWTALLWMKPGIDGSQVGETWETTSETESKGIGLFTLTANSTFSNLASNLATVDAEGSYTFEPQTDANGGSPFSLGDSSYTGHYVWNVDDGLIYEAEVDRKNAVISKIGDKQVTVERGSHMTLKRLEMPKQEPKIMLEPRANPPKQTSQPATPEKPADEPSDKPAAE